MKEISCYDKETKRSEAKEDYSEEIPEDDGGEHSYFFSLLVVCSPSSRVARRLTKCDLCGAALIWVAGWLARNSAQVILPLYTALTNRRKRVEGS